MSSESLPVAPGPDDFRALARSSPWLFTTVHFTHRGPRDAGGETGDTAQAWLDRDARRVTVRAADGVHVEQGVPDSTSGMDAGPSRHDADLVRRTDGLVTHRPDNWHFLYGDPIWRDYRWTAMLDPVELSSGVQIQEVTTGMLRGRSTWSAICIPMVGEGADWEGGYDPRCGCCPLLDSAASRLLEYGTADAAMHFGDVPQTYLVRLDVQTAIVVDVTAMDGWGGIVLTNEVHAVDLPLAPPRLA